MLKTNAQRMWKERVSVKNVWMITNQCLNKYFQRFGEKKLQGFYLIILYDIVEITSSNAKYIQFGSFY